jgi:hypothetical protein
LLIDATATEIAGCFLLTLIGREKGFFLFCGSSIGWLISSFVVKGHKSYAKSEVEKWKEGNEKRQTSACC